MTRPVSGFAEPRPSPLRDRVAFVWTQAIVVAALVASTSVLVWMIGGGGASAG